LILSVIIFRKSSLISILTVLGSINSLQRLTDLQLTAVFLLLSLELGWDFENILIEIEEKCLEFRD
jgi:hypothetical protein